MKLAVYTSFTFSYLAKARVLAETVKKYNPNVDMIALITDMPPKEFIFDVNQEYFDKVIWSKDLGIKNFDSWITTHNIVEACTAVKGPALKYIANKRIYDAVMYLDPDIALFDSLDTIWNELNECSEILLTPHQLTYEDHEDNIAILDNELGSSKHGTYNLGFLCIKTSGAGLEFANWWASRLLKYCREDIPNGLFTDQKWCDLVPAYFNNVKILRNDGYNVASWNISHRKIHITHSGDIKVNKDKLCFFHFTKLGFIGRKMLQRYAGGNYIVYELWRWYEMQVKKHEEEINFNWFYDLNK